jgi:uncharacterized protein YsxB (DUF464 family)
MIEIKIKYGSEGLNGLQTIQEFLVTGHAMNNEGASRELCASISIATTITANAIVFLALEGNVDVERASGYFRINVKKENHAITALLENLRFTLESLKEQYPSHVEEIVTEGLIELDITSELNMEDQLDMIPEMALLTIGNIPLEIPSHPHLSMSKEDILKIQKAYKVVQKALSELKTLKKQIAEKEEK